MTQASGSGGEHRLFWYPDSRKLANRKNHLGTKFDVRGEGGYFVATPSRNGAGGHFWKIDPDETQLAVAPDWLVHWCQTEPRPGDNGKPKSVPPLTTDDVTARAVKYLAKIRRR